ncbi:type II toxin-antitoxin system Phd/YefM family antitoxin [Pontiellaceae bacterium B1224]|nr:type II toxin-antitoxin system Phd/YefM family antitoxin [Pontiellaceae bacterium B1224]
MTAITANDLKKQGVSLLDPILKDEQEAVITVRGKRKYVVMDMEAYNHLRECELDAALMESKRDLETGKFVSESVADHIRRITDDL